MKIKIEKDSAEFYWSIWFNDTRVIFGYDKTYQEAEKNALAKLEQIAKDIGDEIKIHKMKTYQKKPKALQWNSQMGFVDGVEKNCGQYRYNGHRLYDNDWILPETGEVVSVTLFQRFFEEVK